MICMREHIFAVSKISNLKARCTFDFYDNDLSTNIMVLRTFLSSSKHLFIYKKLMAAHSEPALSGRAA